MALILSNLSVESQVLFDIIITQITKAPEDSETIDWLSLSKGFGGKGET